MKITADTNVLIRAIMGDDDARSNRARAALSQAEVVAVTLPTLCEIVWVLSRGYRIPSADIANTLERLIESANVVTNMPAASAGLALLKDGGDFADGVIAYEGRRLGGEVFVSFDRKATTLIKTRGGSVTLL